MFFDPKTKYIWDLYVRWGLERCSWLPEIKRQIYAVALKRWKWPAFLCKRRSPHQDPWFRCKGKLVGRNGTQRTHFTGQPQKWRQRNPRKSPLAKGSFSTRTAKREVTLAVAMDGADLCCGDWREEQNECSRSIGRDCHIARHVTDNYQHCASRWPGPCVVSDFSGCHLQQHL